MARDGPPGTNRHEGVLHGLVHVKADHLAMCILPNSVSPLLVFSSMQVATSILLAAILSFLGLGVQPPTPEWGKMVSDGRAHLLEAPHVSLFPGLAIFFTVMGFNCLGDGLRDTLDPRLRAKAAE